MLHFPTFLGSCKHYTPTKTWFHINIDPRVSHLFFRFQLLVLGPGCGFCAIFLFFFALSQGEVIYTKWGVFRGQLQLKFWRFSTMDHVGLYNNLDLLKVIGYFFIKVNHHQTTIWEKMLWKNSKPKIVTCVDLSIPSYTINQVDWGW